MIAFVIWPFEVEALFDYWTRRRLAEVPRVILQNYKSNCCDADIEIHAQTYTPESFRHVLKQR